MKIAVDCRYLGKSGIGRVCRGILDHLDYRQHEYYLIGSEQALRAYPRAHIVPDGSNPFSAKGMFSFPRALNRVCDALIVPNFIIPFGVRLPVYAVMHDLIFLDMPSIATRGAADRFLKKTLIGRCMKKSARIACVSEFTRSRCEHYYPRLAHKCYVDYVGLSEGILAAGRAEEPKRNTLVFVGNVKPNKGLKTLIEAYRKLPENMFELKIIGEREGFLTGLELSEEETKGIVFTGAMGDRELIEAIGTAKFLVQPSLYEGFGVPPLEAMYLGTKPILSDIPVFREVYGDTDAVFFRCGDADDLKEKILTADPAVRTGRETLTEKYHYLRFTQTLLSQLPEEKDR